MTSPGALSLQASLVLRTGTLTNVRDMGNYDSSALHIIQFNTPSAEVTALYLCLVFVIHAHLNRE
jgi:hypothetical protein